MIFEPIRSSQISDRRAIFAADRELRYPGERCSGRQRTLPLAYAGGLVLGKGRGSNPASKERNSEVPHCRRRIFRKFRRIIYRLQRRAQKCCANVRFYLIVLTSGEYSKGSSGAFSEAISPVVALLNSKTARTYSTVDLATRDLGVVQPGAKGMIGRINKVQKVDFGEYVIPLPLGWRLSKVSATEIFFLTGRVAHCVPDESFAQTSKIKGFGSADCVQLLILHQLRGDDLDAALEQAQARHPLVPSSN
jgi:hypothetical protein